MTTAELTYALCAMTSIIAAALLLRQYRATRTGLLFWSCIGFIGLALNNVLVFVDLALVPTTDLAFVRTLAGAAGLAALLYGLIWGGSQMMPQAVVFMQGLCAATAMAIGLFFLRFWHDSRDRLFLYFAVAFWLMSASWAFLGLVAPAADSHQYIYGLRLVAFLLVIAAIIDKNRSPSR